MRISAKDWENYISQLARVNVAASTEMQRYINKNGMDDIDKLIDYAYGIQARYGEASGALACQMYDEIVEASGKQLPPAEMAEVADYEETAKAINGTIKNMNNTVPSTVGRLVKQVAADTTLKNALRDRAQFAWIPHGDTCAFCLTLASRGWQYMSAKALKGGHAEHIHANCDCEYAISFDEDPVVEGYDPDYYKAIYYGAEGNSSKKKINYLRRMEYANVRGRGEEAERAWKNSKLEASLGENYGPFSKLVNEAPTKGLFNRYSEEATYRRTKSGKYRRADSVVEYSMVEREGLSKYATLAHESGHLFDDKMGRVPGLSYKELDLINERCIIGSGQVKTLIPSPSNSDEFLSALRKDMEALKPKVSDKSIKDELLETVSKRNSTCGLQDALDGFYSTTDMGLLPWGHGNKYYNRGYNHRVSTFDNEKSLKDAYNEMGFDASNQAKAKRLFRVYETASEAWANVTSAYTCGGDALTYMKQYMPETCKAYMRIVGGVASG